MVRQRRRRIEAQRREQNKALLILSGILVFLLAGVIAVAGDTHRPSHPKLEFIEVRDESMKDILNRLVSTHPKREIREDLLRSILAEEIYFALYDFSSPTTQGVFGLRKRGERLVPTFTFARYVLQESESDLWEQTLLWHEYQHFLGWKKGKYPEHYMIPPPLKFTAEELRMLYEEEVNAYTEQCVFASEFGISGKFDICMVREKEGVLAFRQVVATLVANKFQHNEGVTAFLSRLARGYGY